jgi:hypothetical protein
VSAVGDARKRLHVVPAPCCDAAEKVARVSSLARHMQDMADSAINPDNREYLGAFAKSLAAALDGPADGAA